MSEPRLFWYERKELRNPIAIIGFPSIGLVGSILTSYLARELKLEVVAGMTIGDIQQYTLISGGTPYPPIRVYAGALPRPKRKKKNTETVSEEGVNMEVHTPRKKARDVIIVTSELTPRPEQAYDFTLFVIGLVKEMGAQEIVFVDGFPRVDNNATLMAAYSDQNAKQLLLDANIKTFDEGLVRGISGVGLFQGKIDRTSTVCILAPANPQLPDPRAAADALESLKKLIPKLEVDPSPLMHEAEEIDARIRAQQNHQNAINRNIYG